MLTGISWTSSLSATQLKFVCGGYTDGTSGSPWVTHFHRRTRTGTMVGMIGGYQQGGDSPAVSHSRYFGPAARRLYQQVLARDDAPRLWGVINEAAVRRVVGSFVTLVGTSLAVS